MVWHGLRLRPNRLFTARFQNKIAKASCLAVISANAFDVTKAEAGMQNRISFAAGRPLRGKW
jgi:hypothetical protein